MKSREEITRHFRRCEEHFDRIYFLHGKTNPRENSQFPSEFHTSIDLWLAGVEGLQRTLEWGLGRLIFYEAFYLMTHEYLKKMRLNFWNEDWAYLPFGEPLPFEHAKVPTHHVVTAEQIQMVLTRAVAVQNRVMSIEKVHPGMWSPMFHGRVKKWLVNTENIIRVTEWMLGKRSIEDAFYLVENQALHNIDQARKGGVLPIHSGGIAQVNSLVGMDIGPEDHKPEDFQ